MVRLTTNRSSKIAAFAQGRDRTDGRGWTYCRRMACSSIPERRPESVCAQDIFTVGGHIALLVTEGGKSGYVAVVQLAGPPSIPHPALLCGRRRRQWTKAAACEGGLASLSKMTFASADRGARARRS